MYGRSTNSFCASLWSTVPRLICSDKQQDIDSQHEIYKVILIVYNDGQMEAFLHLVESQLKTRANPLQVSGFGATIFLEDVMSSMTKRKITTEPRASVYGVFHRNKIQIHGKSAYILD